MNYMWLVQDLIAEGNDPTVLFLFFFSFFVISVLILVNLFAIVVLGEPQIDRPCTRSPSYGLFPHNR